MSVFDATQHEPQQVGGKHPPGNKFPFVITATEVKDVKDGHGKKYYEVTFTSPAGSIRNNYNLWNDSEQARKISVGQLSALCHATGIFKINFKDPIAVGVDGRELIGGKGLMDVGFQAGQEPSAEKPEGGYVEIKKIYDVNGNEPGKGPATQQAQTTQQHTVQSGWAAPNKEAAPATANWGPGTNPNPAPAGGGWQPGAGSTIQEKPPWS